MGRLWLKGGIKMGQPFRQCTAQQQRTYFTYLRSQRSGVQYLLRAGRAGALSARPWSSSLSVDNVELDKQVAKLMCTQITIFFHIEQSY